MNPESAVRSTASVKIVLVAGSMRMPDKPGHHDYAGGCTLLGMLLEQTPGVRAVVVRDGWPQDETVFDGAQALVYYAGGGNEQAALQSPQRLERLQRLVDSGVGIVMIHQAVRYPTASADLACSWLGGVYLPGASQRGHWHSRHREFPDHAVTHGLQAWEIHDGWHNRIHFVDGLRGVTPLLWSSAKHAGSSAGGAADIVSWAYERPQGGRSFCFTGLDAHGAWSFAGLRQLIVNGVLWTAGQTIPTAGAPCAVEAAALRGYMTPRGSTGERLLAAVGRRLRRLAR